MAVLLVARIRPARTTALVLDGRRRLALRRKVGSETTFSLHWQPSVIARKSSLTLLFDADGGLVPYDRDVGLALDQAFECLPLRGGSHATLQRDELARRRHPHARIAKTLVGPDRRDDAVVDLRIALVRAATLAGAGEATRRASLDALVRRRAHLLLGEHGRLGDRAGNIAVGRLCEWIELIRARLYG